MDVVSKTNDSSDIATWGETILGVLPVLAPILAFSLAWTGDPFSELLTGLGFLFMLILPIIAILVIVRRDHWQWFWTYFGLIVFDIMFITQAAFSKEIVSISWLVWLLRTASIILVVFIIYFLVKLQERLTVRPTANFDMLNFLLLAVFIVQYLILAVFEGTPAVFRLPYSLLCGGILALGIVVYLRTRWRWLRLVSLLVAFSLAVYMANTVSGIYWSTHPIGLG